MLLWWDQLLALAHNADQGDDPWFNNRLATCELRIGQRLCCAVTLKNKSFASVAVAIFPSCAAC